jgi:HSP20 family protein
MRTIPVTTWNRALPLTRALDEMLGVNRLANWLNDGDRAADAYQLYLDLPGVRADHIEITFDRGALTIAGTRERGWAPTQEQTHRVHAAERFEGRFSRSFRLPEHVDGDAIEASFQDGVLIVSARKAQNALPRRIKVNPASGTAISGPASQD